MFVLIICLRLKYGNLDFMKLYLEIGPQGQAFKHRRFTVRHIEGTGDQDDDDDDDDDDDHDGDYNFDDNHDYASSYACNPFRPHHSCPFTF